MYVNIIIYSNKLLLFTWSTLKKEKKKKSDEKLNVARRKCLAKFCATFSARDNFCV